MLKNLWKLITLLVVLIVLYGVVDIYHCQYNIIKYAKKASEELISAENINAVGQQIKGKAYTCRDKLSIKDIELEHKRLYSSSQETNGRIPYQIDIVIHCKQSFLGLFAVERSFGTTSTVYLLP